MFSVSTKQSAKRRPSTELTFAHSAAESKDSSLFKGEKNGRQPQSKPENDGQNSVGVTAYQLRAVGFEMPPHSFNDSN